MLYEIPPSRDSGLNNNISYPGQLWYYSGWPCQSIKKRKRNTSGWIGPKILGIECRSILHAESGIDRTDPKLLQAAVPGLGLKAESRHLQAGAVWRRDLLTTPRFRESRRDIWYHQYTGAELSFTRLMTTTTGLDDDVDGVTAGNSKQPSWREDDHF